MTAPVTLNLQPVVVAAGVSRKGRAGAFAAGLQLVSVELNLTHIVTLS